MYSKWPSQLASASFYLCIHDWHDGYRNEVTIKAQMEAKHRPQSMNWSSCYHHRMLNLPSMGNYVKFSIWHSFLKKPNNLLVGKLAALGLLHLGKTRGFFSQDRYIFHIWVCLSWLQALSSISNIIQGLIECLIHKHEIPHNIILG